MAKLEHPAVSCRPGMWPVVRRTRLHFALLTLLCNLTLASALAQESPAEQVEAEPAAEQNAQPASAAEPAEPASAPSTAEPAATSEPSRAVLLEDIVVTAGKREQRLQDIAGSVGVLSGDDLEDLKAQGLADYIKRVPGVVLVDRGVDGSAPVIRGITTNTSLVGGQFTQAPVGIYVDDMPFADLFVAFTQPDINPFDLERVEILKGPQGTLFGAGALAGAIRYILKKPYLDTWEGKLSATVTSNDFSDGMSPVYAGAANIPFGDSVAFRVVGVGRKESGTFDEFRPPSSDVDKLKQDTTRALARWDVSEKLKLSALHFSQESDRDSAPFADNRETFDRIDHIVLAQSSAITGTNITAGYDFDRANLVLSTNRLTKDAINLVQGPAGIANPLGDPDGDGGDNGPGTEDIGLGDVLRNRLDSATEGVFHELRLLSPAGADFQPWDWLGVQWLAGAAYQRSKQSLFQRQDAILVQDVLVPLLALAPIFPVPTPIGPLSGEFDTSVIYVDLDSVATESSLFGEATFKLGQYLELTAGARKFKTKLTATGFFAGLQAVALNQMTQIPIDTGTGADGINPRYSLRVLFNENIQLFALAAKGFQFGGVQLNPPARALTTASGSGFFPYDSSKLWNYELGLRTEFFGGALKWDTTLFYLDWKDLQITVVTEAVPGGTCCGLTFGLTENIGAAISKGVESSLSLTPINGLNFTSSVAFIDARTAEDFDSSAGFVTKGTRLPASAKFQMANILSYTAPIPFFDNVNGSAALTHSHIGSSYNDLQRTREQGGYSTLDASFNLVKLDWNLVPDLTVSLLNLTDERGVSAVNAAAGARSVNYYFVRPRSVLVSLGVKF